MGTDALQIRDPRRKAGRSSALQAPATPQHIRGIASPKGEARRSAPARQSAANAARGTLLTRVRVELEVRVERGDRGAEKPATRGCVERLGFLPGRGKKARRGPASNGSACKSGRSDLRAGTRQASPRRARQSAVAAVLQIGTCDVDSDPHRAFFQRPSIHIQVRSSAAPGQPSIRQQAVARARRAKPGANAPARRSAANAAPGTLLTRVRVTSTLRAGVGACLGAVGRDRQPPKASGRAV